MTLIFATNNDNKVKEIRQVLRPGLNILSLQEAGIHIDIPEPHDTLEENALEKSRVIHTLTGADCFSEDTGLEVEALGGAPGVRSARYTGEGKDFEANIDRLLAEMKGKSNRNAQFRTVISLIINGKETMFEGVCPGELLTGRRGNQGFGYDPIFQPLGDERSFGEMTLPEKSRYSHRRKATEQLVAFLNKANKNQQS